MAIITPLLSLQGFLTNLSYFSPRKIKLRPQNDKRGITFEISSYELTVARRMSAVLTGQHFVWRSDIYVYGSGYLMILYFVDDVDSAPDNLYYAPRKAGFMLLPVTQYNWYVDILRNESPVFAQIYTHAPNANRLYTGSEPTGEGEVIV